MSRNFFRNFALLAVVCFSTTAFSQQTPEPPPMPVAKPPVEFFRQLLALSPAARAEALKNRSPESKTNMLAKIREYEAMTSDERELRLRATELRWYLLTLMPLAPTNRAPQLTAISEPMRNLVADRLVTWDRLSPAAQEAVLKGESSLQRTVNILTRKLSLPTTNTVKLSPEQAKKFEDDLARFRQLPSDEQKLIGQHFNNFFDLNPEEKTKVLRVLSDSERKEMERTLKQFANLPRDQRAKCVSAFTKLAELSPDERRQFLQNAERWQAMPAADRKAWRDLVHKLPEPPAPPGLNSSTTTAQAVPVVFTNNR